MYNRRFINNVKERFIAEQNHAVQKIAELKAPLLDMDNPDSEERDFLVEEQIRNQSLLQTYCAIKERTEADLERIEKGTYGRCLGCGTRIPQHILEDQPWAEHCNKCIRKRISNLNGYC